MGYDVHITRKDKASGHESYFFWYVTIWAAISLLVYLRMPETNVRRRQ
ncbi:hypothetical protein PQQ75_15900 [Paraburkholderia aspalathi]